MSAAFRYSCGWMSLRSMPHQVKRVHSGLERAHHTHRGFMEHAIGNVVKQVALEREVDDEVDMGLVPGGPERPGIGEMLERTVGRAHQDPVRSIEGDVAGEAFLERAEADHEIGDNLLRILMPNARAATPGHEGGIILDVRHYREEFFGSIGKDGLFFMTRHAHPPLMATNPIRCVQPVKW